MAKFRLPPVSPLIGSTVFTFYRTLRGKVIDRKHIPKLLITFIVILLSSPFRWFDQLYFNYKLKNTGIRENPIFIIGHWRTGTTFLHNVLAQDRRMGFVTTYQSVFPNNLLTRFLFRPFMKAHIPETRPGDNVRLAVNYPQEDEFALSNLIPFSYYQFMYFPRDYREYYDNYIRFEGKDKVFLYKWKKKYYRLITQALINMKGRIPLLKNPCNTGRIKLILELFPEARFIVTLRNPVIVFLSTRKFMFELLPTLQLHNISTDEIEEMIFEVFDLIIHDYLKMKHLIPDRNLIEVKFDEYLNNPLSFVEEVYRKFDLQNFEQVRPGIKKYLALKAGYKKNKYEITRDLLDKILKRWKFAMDLWVYDIPGNIKIIEK